MYRYSIRCSYFERILGDVYYTIRTLSITAASRSLAIRKARRNILRNAYCYHLLVHSAKRSS